MSATTLKITDALKRRIVAAARASDKSPHAFMLEAIEQQTRLDEQRRAFAKTALVSREEALESGEGFAMADVHRYILGRASGRKASRPKPVKWRE
jgi:predicted transcriptional regulator